MENKDQNFNEIVTIVVGKHEYTVCKRLICSVVPYFEKMFCCDLLESKENKVELDFDERVFDIILHWVHSETLNIQMDCVISLYDLADYLMINDNFFQSCVTYFYDKFTIEHIPVVLKQVTKTSKLINSDAISNIICRYFLMIVNTKIFLDYPVETVEAILEMDLQVHSEYQIFEAIVKWVEKDPNSRDEHLDRLMNCVRWSLIDFKDVKLLTDCREFCAKNLQSVKKYFKYFRNFILPSFVNSDGSSEDNLVELIQTRLNITSSDKCVFPRSKKTVFISLQLKGDENLWINLYDEEFRCQQIVNFTLDETMSLEFIHGEHIQDILFNSETKGVRIDFINMTFTWLTVRNCLETYNCQLLKFIVYFPMDLRFSEDIENFSCKLEDASCVDVKDLKEKLPLEYNGRFVLIGKSYDGKLIGHFPVTDPNYFMNFKNQPTFQATILDDMVYILTKDFAFLRFDIKRRSLLYLNAYIDIDLDYNELILTSHAKYDDEVIVVNKLSGKVYVYSINEDKWIEKCQITNIKYCIENVNADSKLIGFTSTFLPVKIIKPLYAKELIIHENITE